MSTRVILAVFTVLYLVPTMALAKHKLFWDDEFFTFYLARVSGWQELLKALATGADQHPPSFYYVTRISQAIFGPTHVATRLPEILGFWLMCVCLFLIVRHAANTLWGVVAMLFPLSTKLYGYSVEARGYGLVVGWTALALLAWMRVSEDRRRGLYLPLLAFGVMAAVGSHYYAALVPACLGLGEVVRTWSRRRIDWPVWVALSFGLLPLLAFHRTIQSAHGYSSHFWAVPSWPDALVFYNSEFGSAVVAQVIALAVVLLVQLRTKRSELPSRLELSGFLRRWEIVAVLALSALPIFVMLAAKLVTHGYTDRYAIASLVGITVLLVCMYSRVMPNSVVGGAIVACLAMFAYQALSLRATDRANVAVLGSAYRLLKGTGNQTIACVDYTTFHKLSFYAPRQLASRLTYLSDPAASVQYLGHDTVDRGLLDLSPWFPIRVLPVGSFLATHREFLAFGYISDYWSWLPYELPTYGRTEMLARDRALLLFAVHDASAKRMDPEIEARYPQSAMLFRTLPTTGPSECVRIMGEAACPKLVP